MRVFRLLLVALFLAGCSVISIDFTPRIQPLREQTVEGTGAGKVLLMDLSGVISEEPLISLGAQAPRVSILARVREELKKAEDDDRIQALVVRINSPGGTATASDILYRELSAFKARKKIPVVAAIMDVGASGGYYVALAADTIVAHPTTVTGSIGVVMLTLNAEGLLQKVGIAPLAIKSGAKKDMGSPFRGLSDEERQIFQGVIDDLYGRFVSLIAKERRMPEDKVRAFADGRIYTARQAKELGLVDRVGYLEEAVEAAKQAARLSEARVVMYHRPREYRSNIYSGTPVPEPIQPSLLQLSSLLIGPGPRFLYLWWP
ncbi:MAG: putative signal peptide peptidase SppA, protease IV [Candidatus Rokubacteria bacterium CSP1-6]|nr:MAG: putative signal peptide peptidase SppA, protease IV [Candidatus Rokubacteria bacterium CSP1-6]